MKPAPLPEMPVEAGTWHHSQFMQAVDANIEQAHAQTDAWDWLVAAGPFGPAFVALDTDGRPPPELAHQGAGAPERARGKRTCTTGSKFHDHLDSWEPTWLRDDKLETFRRQLKNGEAQWLCFVCNDIKTNGSGPGQGDSVPHASRVACQRNLAAHGHLLPTPAAAEVNLARGLAISAGHGKRKRAAAARAGPSRLAQPEESSGEE